MPIQLHIQKMKREADVIKKNEKSANDYLTQTMLANRLLFASICDRIQLKEAMIMARTANVFARVEPELKEQAESVLDQLGIPMSNAVGMFLRQIVLQKGIPFEMKLPRTAPLTYGSLTKEQFDKEIEKGMSDVKAGRVYSADAIEAEMKRDFGI